MARFHGRPLLPSPELEPFGAAYHPACVPGAGGAVTVIAEEPLLPPVAAVMVAEPMVTPDTKPLLLTVATVVALLDHVIERPDTVLPAESLGVAVSCTVFPVATLADAGLTTTEATGTIAAVIVDVPLLPPLAAVIVAEPALLAVTSPLPLTFAIVVSLLDHTMVWPVSGLPAESFGVAASCTVCPTNRLAAAGLTVTEAMVTFATAIADVPLFPPVAAVIVAEPAPFPVTSPLVLTVAIVVLSLDQVTTRPVSGLPAESLGVAVSCTVCPTYRLPDAGVTVTDATGTVVTVTLEEALRPSLAAVIVVEPAATPVTSPLAVTVATPVLLLDQVTVLPVSTAPVESRVVAVSCTVCVGSTLADAGLTLIEATGGRVTATVAVSAKLVA